MRNSSLTVIIMGIAGMAAVAMAAPAFAHSHKRARHAPPIPPVAARLSDAWSGANSRL
jgi:hypothetical protein